MRPRILLIGSLLFFVATWVYFLLRPQSPDTSIQPIKPVIETKKDSVKLTGTDSAKMILRAAIDTMRLHSVYRDALHWDTVYKAAEANMTHTGHATDAYPAIRWIIRQMKDHHSFLMSAKDVKGWQGKDTATKEKPQVMGTCVGKVLTGNIGYVRIPWVFTGDSTQIQMVADSIHGIIRQVDVTHPSRWIVDLRGNTGGNCWPMIAGLGALIGNGNYGFFISTTDTTAWSYRDGVALSGGESVVKVSRPYTVVNDNPKIAVLIDSNTASSGEIVALSCKGMLNTRFFGMPTGGFTTANASFTMPDSSLLFLASSFEADRTGQVYRGKIAPDVVVTKRPTSAVKDPVREAAANWLNREE